MFEPEELPMPAKIARIMKLKVPTQERNQMVDVTAQVAQLLQRERIEDGVVMVYSPHTTAGVCIQENADADVKSDLLAKLSALIPKSEGFYRHAEGNSDSHLKTVVTGNSVQVMIEGGKLLLGRWQGIYFCEFDGPRERELWLKPIYESRGSDVR
jgi:secondary thiamine-phosphate synthase enzyme